MLYPIPIAVKPIEDFQLLVTFEGGENAFMTRNL